MNSFEILLDDTRKIVRLTATGTIDYPVLEKMIDAARKTAIETGYDILYDVRQARTKVSIGDLFFIPRNLEVFKDSRSQKALAVILASTEDKGIEGYKFYTTVLGNLGYKIRLFYEENDAVEWLLGHESEDENNFNFGS